MSRLDPAHYRELLEKEKAATDRVLAELDADIDALVGARNDSNHDDEHDPEGVTIAFERSQADALRGQAQHRLREIAEALERIDAGTYGTCEVCGKPIGWERLTARPYARTCIEHASA